MNIKNALLLIIKVILLLCVILIFSYVNTKKAHIAKMKKNEKIATKKNVKEGIDHDLNTQNTDNSGVIINEHNVNNVVDDIVNKTKKRLDDRYNSHGANQSQLKYSIDSLIRNSTNPEGFVENMSIDEMKGNGECKYEGKTIISWIAWFLQKILYIFIWLANAIYNLIPEKNKEKPRQFFEILFMPFDIILNVFHIIFKIVAVVFSKLQYFFIYFIATIGNILFVFAPSFVIDILSYFLAPFVVLFRKMTSVFSIIPNPFSSVCWVK